MKFGWKSIPVVLAMLGVLFCGQACDKGNAPASNAPPADTSSSNIPNGPQGTFDLVFSDEFDGATVDTSKWNLTWPWSTPLNNTLQNYDPANAVVSGGQLNLIGENRPSGGQNFSSGAVTTYQRHTFFQKIFEARMKVPAGKGFWSAFWMIYPTGFWPPEIDVLEVLGPTPSYPFMTYHWLNGATQASQNIPALNPVVDLSLAFHTYTVDWQPTGISWYIDGVKQGEFTDVSKLPNQAVILLLNLSIGGSAGGFGPGAPDATTPFPSTLAIDYVRVWSRR